MIHVHSCYSVVKREKIFIIFFDINEGISPKNIYHLIDSKDERFEHLK
jgi:hypothetical protein